MNKALVEKLAVQSLVWVDTGLADGREQIFSTSVFAELIVRECVDQIEIERGNPYRNLGDHHQYATSACDESIRRIKEHFGVGE
jgi:hypothetical protein